jgi:hypothetical protein
MQNSYEKSLFELLVTMVKNFLGLTNDKELIIYLESQGSKMNFTDKDFVDKDLNCKQKLILSGLLGFTKNIFINDIIDQTNDSLPIFCKLNEKFKQSFERLQVQLKDIYANKTTTPLVIINQNKVLLKYVKSYIDEIQYKILDEKQEMSKIQSYEAMFRQQKFDSQQKGYQRNA